MISAELYYVVEVVSHEWVVLLSDDVEHEGVVLLPWVVELGPCIGSTWQRAQMCQFA